MENFKELSFEEMQEIDGGFWGVVVGGLIVAAAVEIIGDWGNFKRGIYGAPPMR